MESPHLSLNLVVSESDGWGRGVRTSTRGNGAMWCKSAVAVGCRLTAGKAVGGVSIHCSVETVEKHTQLISSVLTAVLNSRTDRLGRCTSQAIS